MSMLMIKGGRPLRGTVSVHGAKNSVLPVLAACCAAGSECRVENCPRITDVDAAISILRCLGCRADISGSTVTVDPTNAARCDIPPHLMREMRSSIAFLGALMARYGHASLSLPGGCELGARPIDLHLAALAKMGAEISESRGTITCTAKGRLHGADIALSFPSVGATENIMTAAAAAKGTTVITNAACEPEVSDLAAFLRGCGARISGAGSPEMIIDGVDALHGCTHTVIPDRIEAATVLACCAAAGGSVTLENVCPKHLDSVTALLERMGCLLSITDSTITLTAPQRLSAAGNVRTMPYPGFPTDAQAIMMAAACTANGTSVFIENIFDGRFKHVAQLCRMGAHITVEGRAAVVEGAAKLCGTRVCASDLRGGAALIAAGLAAEGTTVIDGLRHIRRGYQSPETMLKSLGAEITLTDGNF